MRCFRALAAALLLTVAAPTLAIADAEFAIRWDPAEGGPQTADEVRTALGLQRGKEKEFVVQYFTVNQPGNAAGDYKAIARERKTRTGADTTYKLRGSTSFPESRTVSSVGLSAQDSRDFQGRGRHQLDWRTGAKTGVLA